MRAVFTLPRVVISSARLVNLRQRLVILRVRPGGVPARLVILPPLAVRSLAQFVNPLALAGGDRVPPVILQARCIILLGRRVVLLARSVNVLPRLVISVARTVSELPRLVSERVRLVITLARVVISRARPVIVERRRLSRSRGSLEPSICSYCAPRCPRPTHPLRAYPPQPNLDLSPFPR